MSRTKEYLASMVETYAKTLLWTGMDWDDLDECDNPSRLDAAWTVEEVAPEAWESMEEDCNNFLELTWKVEGVEKVDAVTMGYNFALTRNRHGAGFWDIGLGVLGDRLTELAHTFGEQNFYVNEERTQLHVD